MIRRQSIVSNYSNRRKELSHLLAEIEEKFNKNEQESSNDFIDEHLLPEDRLLVGNEIQLLEKFDSIQMKQLNKQKKKEKQRQTLRRLLKINQKSVKVHQPKRNYGDLKKKADLQA